MFRVCEAVVPESIQSRPTLSELEGPSHVLPQGKVRLAVSGSKLTHKEKRLQKN